VIWKIRDQTLDVSQRTLVMGVLNVTPDSFSDGGKFFPPEKAVAHGIEMADAGADIIDVGGESTRPNAEPVGEKEEWQRVLPVIEALSSKISAPISVDTTKARVAKAALEAGASIINDISALRFDEKMVEIAREFRAGVVLMHMQGTPKTMQNAPKYDDVVAEIIEFLRDRIEFCVKNGVEFERIAVDPGIGFGKTVGHNVEILQKLGAFSVLERPILVGPSRKSFLGKLLGLPRMVRGEREPSERIFATAAAVSCAILRGAHVVRVHDVAEMRDVAQICDALKQS
jgi:dihydropteroate synthase